jgi:hypothetical protein
MDQCKHKRAALVGIVNGKTLKVGNALTPLAVMASRATSASTLLKITESSLYCELSLQYVGACGITLYNEKLLCNLCSLLDATIIIGFWLK